MDLLEELRNQSYYKEPVFKSKKQQALYRQYYQNMERIIVDEESLLKFFSFSSQIYKYDVTDMIYVFGQNSNVTHLADYETWNKIGRFIKLGSKAIHVLKYEDGQYKQNYLFDVSQTGGAEFNFPDWKIEQAELNSLVGNSLEDFIEDIYNSSNHDEDYGYGIVKVSSHVLLEKFGLEVDKEDTKKFLRKYVNDIDSFNFMKELIELNQEVLSQINTLRKENNQTKETELTHESTQTKSIKYYTVPNLRGVRESAETRQVRKGNYRLSKREGLSKILFTPLFDAAAELRSVRSGESMERDGENRGRIASSEPNAENSGPDDKSKTLEQNEINGRGNREEESHPNAPLISEIGRQLAGREKPATVSEDKNSSMEMVQEINLFDFYEEEKADFSFTEEDNYADKPLQRVNDNIKAIELSKLIESENRSATPEEQQILAKYVGWGGLYDAFDDRNNKYQEQTEKIKELLTPEEYSNARESILTAYYTDPIIVSAIYKKIEELGFKSGNILDPAMGTGNFYSAMPGNMKNNSTLYGVELDTVTGKIAKQLHQTASIQIKGFEKAEFDKGTFDIVVGNVPFSSERVYDNEEQRGRGLSLHNYFINKSIDLVKENGIVAVITSASTMDAGPEFRMELSRKAELLGAVRLPNNAFKAIAGTEAVSDILILQKLPKDYEREVSPEWVWSAVDPDHPGIYYNDYFIKHPEQILGEVAVKHYHNATLTVIPHKDISLDEQLNEALSRIKGTYTSHEKPTGIVSSKKINSEISHTLSAVKKVEEIIPIEEALSTDSISPYSYVEYKGDVYFYENGQFEKELLPPKTKEKVIHMISIKEAVMDVIDYQQLPSSNRTEFETKLIHLNKVYDDFVLKHGFLNERVNKNTFMKDDSAPLLQSIEDKVSDTEYKKADIFKRETIRPKIDIKQVDTAKEALNLSLNRLSKIDFDYIQTIYPKNKTDIIKELGADIFVDPDKFIEAGYDLNKNVWEPKESYLYGNVKEKLNKAQALISVRADIFEVNVTELEKVIPEDLKPSEIDFKIGSTWIPKDYYEEFMYETFKTPEFLKTNRYRALDIDYDAVSDIWFVNGKNLDKTVTTTSKYGTKRASAYKIYEDSLNLKSTKVLDSIPYTDENGNDKRKYVVNPKETMVARGKQEEIQLEFENWLFKDTERTTNLIRIYNDTYNCIRPRSYNGQDLMFEGMNAQFELRLHQKNVVARILHTGKALMAHDVGAGKTASMISAGMMMKDQGLIQKPLYVVPNHLTQQFGQELLRFYPGKKVLITSKSDFTKNNRKRFVAKIATGNYDAIIIGHSQFEKIPMSPEYREESLKKQISEVTEAIISQKSEKSESWSLKQMIRFEKSLKDKLKKLRNESGKDNLLNFEQLGVDFLFVDEAHIYKNLATFTKLTNVAGVNTSNSQRASDMEMKCHYLQSQNKGRGVVFATGTPISNSMSEMYTMQRFLQPDVLRKMNLSSFDRWASTFGEITSTLEITPEGGGYRMRDRFAKFHNLPELMNSFSLIADIQTTDMLNLPVPDIKGGKAQIIVSEANEYQIEKMEEFTVRAEEIRLGNVNPSEDNMLKLTHEAKLMAIDPRLIDKNAEYDPQSKLGRCSEIVHKIWQDSVEIKSTQMIFSDSGTPKPNKFNVYDELKSLLIEKGIPKEEIAFIHDAKTDTQRDNLFEKMRSGEVRILFGSTSKVGTGTNVQDKLLAAHHIDCPWRPSDVTQRDGRIVRQGNENKQVEVYRYVTKNSFDSYLWQIQEQKLRFISQVMTGKSISRSCDDLDETVLSASEVKAVATGNPLLAEKMNLDNEVARLQIMKSNWLSEQLRLKSISEETNPNYIKQNNVRFDLYKQDYDQFKSYEGQEFSIEILGQVFTERAKAGDVLNSALSNCLLESEPYQVGNYRGFNLSVQPGQLGGYILTAQGEAGHKATIYGDSGVGSIVRIENVLKALDHEMNMLTAETKELESEIESAKRQLQVPFSQEERLVELKKKQSEIDLKIELQTQTDQSTESKEVNEENQSKAPEVIIDVYEPRDNRMATTVQVETGIER